MFRKFVPVTLGLALSFSAFAQSPEDDQPSSVPPTEEPGWKHGDKGAKGEDGWKKGEDGKWKGETAQGELDEGQIARIVGLADMTEMQLSELAMSRAEDQQVKDFAQRMRDEHQKVDDQLAQVLGDEQIQGKNSDASKEMLKAGRELRQELGSLRGAEFDRAYIDGQIELHGDLLAALDQYLGKSSMAGGSTGSGLEDPMDDMDGVRPVSGGGTTPGQPGSMDQPGSTGGQPGMGQPGGTVGDDDDVKGEVGDAGVGKPETMGGTEEPESFQALIQTVRGSVQTHLDEAKRIQGQLGAGSVGFGNDQPMPGSGDDVDREMEPTEDDRDLTPVGNEREIEPVDEPSEEQPRDDVPMDEQPMDEDKGVEPY